MKQICRHVCKQQDYLGFRHFPQYPLPSFPPLGEEKSPACPKNFKITHDTDSTNSGGGGILLALFPQCFYLCSKNKEGLDISWTGIRRGGEGNLNEFLIVPPLRSWYLDCCVFFRRQKKKCSDSFFCECFVFSLWLIGTWMSTLTELLIDRGTKKTKKVCSKLNYIQILLTLFQGRIF